MRTNALCRRLRRAGVTALLVVLVAPVVGCGGSSSPSEPAEPSATTTGPVASAPATPSPSPDGRGGGVVPRRKTAADQLADFFSAAARMDGDLRDAAKRINGGVRRDVVVLEPATVAAVLAIKPSALVGTIPGGMDRELLRRVMLVYSDLVSRRLAMSRVVQFDGLPPLPRAGAEARELIECLGNGSPAAKRFAGDLAAARALASTSDPIAVAPRKSRATAEVAVRVRFIDMFNGGCNACGGGVLTNLLPIVWKRQGGFDGTIDGIPFRATYTSGSGWKAEINAC